MRNDLVLEAQNEDVRSNRYSGLKHSSSQNRSENLKPLGARDPNMSEPLIPEATANQIPSACLIRSLASEWPAANVDYTSFCACRTFSCLSQIPITYAYRL